MRTMFKGLKRSGILISYSPIKELIISVSNARLKYSAGKGFDSMFPIVEGGFRSTCSLNTRKKNKE